MGFIVTVPLAGSVALSKVRVPPLVVLSLPATVPLTGLSSSVVLVSGAAVRSTTGVTTTVIVLVVVSPLGSVTITSKVSVPCQSLLGTYS